MLKSPLLFAISVLITLFHWTGVARAEESSLALSFELPAAKEQVSATIKEQPAELAPAELIKQPTAEPPLETIAEPAPAPVKESSPEAPPATASYIAETLPPIQTSLDVSSDESSASSADALTKSTPVQTDDVALSFAASSLTFPEAISQKAPSKGVTELETYESDLNEMVNSSVTALTEPAAPVEQSLQANEPTRGLEALDFTLPSGLSSAMEDSGRSLTADLLTESPELHFSASSIETAGLSDDVALSAANALSGLDDWIFADGTESLVARTVGSAEGTRHWNGQRTRAYYGHTDPGNGVWNLGTFSYQHEAHDPADADEKQLLRLKRQGSPA